VRALLQTDLNGPASLAIAEVPIPDRADAVLVDVAVAGIGFPDLLFSRGEYQEALAPPFVPGYEVAGTVRSAPASSGFEPGHRVLAFTMQGGHAEVAAAAPEMTLSLRDDLGFAEAVRLGTNYQTAYLALAIRGRAAAGETAVVFGAGGGLGNALVDVADALGLTVIAVAGSEEKRELARAAGATYVLAPDGDIVADVRELAPGKVDLVLDPVGVDPDAVGSRLLAEGGRLVVLGFAAGGGGAAPVGRLMVRNADLVGVVWGAAARRDPTLPGEIWGELLKLRARGLIDAPEGPSFRLEEAPAVLEMIAARRLTGKAVLAVGAPG
jgi:NADPH2:quinone reductase